MVNINCIAKVAAGDIIRLYASNDTGSRGNADNSASRLMLSYVGSTSGGGTSFDPTEVNYTFSDFHDAYAGYSIMPADQQALVDNVVDGIYTSLDEYMNVYAQMICGLWDYNSYNS